MNKNSPFCVETQLGKLELTKGNYLTLQKRKSSTFRTLPKNKIIFKDCAKATLKRTRERSQPPGHNRELHLYDSHGQRVTFNVVRERSRMLGSLPSIEMAYDNDE